MNMFRKTACWLSDLGRVFRNEFRLITGDFGVLIFFVVLPLLYPVVYTLIYNPEVVRELPIAVVDNSRTAASRDFVRRADASPSISVYAYCNDMAEARSLMASHDVYGVMEIPSDYARDLGTGTPANVSFYSDMSLLLRYRTYLMALTDLQMDVISSVTGERIDATGLESLAAGGGLPIQSKANFLGDPEQGFASFIMPGIVILILQQSMLLGLGMLGGTSRERRRANGGVDPREVHDVGPMARIWGRALACIVFYIPMTLYVMAVIPEMFSLPHYGAPVDYLLFIFPMLLASAFMGQFLVLFLKERESAFLLLVFTSVVFLFISGLTWPRYAMGPVWTWIGNCIPAVWGVEGFVRINSNAATLAENTTPYVAMWILAVIYMFAAWGVTKWLHRRGI